ncbi:MAG TPA: RagB/SusD family nutrient uptake outer membrane protein [Puia sp.]|nr:RagB/SusD family nutrient uptake outer membrane protein [Puia sp.]
MNLRITVLMCCTVLSISCNKYLDVKPKGVTLLSSVTDYDQWLNSTNIEGYIPREINLMADNVDNPVITTAPTAAKDLVYIWNAQFSQDVNGVPIIWKNFYQTIYYFNTVLQGIDNATGGTSQDKQRLKAEALLGRSFDYLYLVNLYGKHFDSATASGDLSIPFVTTNDIGATMPQRSTVKQIYDHIISDVTAAIPYLSTDNSKNRYRGSMAAGYSVLARTYLYLSDYTEAAKYAQLALDNGPNKVLDYNSISDASAISTLIFRPDAIYARISLTIADAEIPTLEFLKSFDTADLRLKYYYTNLGDYSFTVRGSTQYIPYGIIAGSGYPNWGTSVAEMRLIIAEAGARSGDLPTALDQLDQVRKSRIKTAYYQPYYSNDKDSVFRKVLLERAQEFAFNGLRWFDMRRLAVEGLMPDVKRYDGSGNVIASLPSTSPRYILQIPLQVLYYNSGWPQNP